MMYLSFPIIFQPLLQVSVLADNHRRKLFQVGFQLLHVVRITVQRKGSNNNVIGCTSIVGPMQMLTGVRLSPGM